MNVKNKDIILSIFILIFIIITSFFIGYSWNNIVVKKDKKDSNLKIEHLDDKNTKNNSNEPNNRYGVGFALSSKPFLGTILVSPVKPSNEEKRNLNLSCSL